MVKPKTTYLFSCSFLLCFFFYQAQDRYMDSLKTAYRTFSNDSNKVNVMIDLAEACNKKGDHNTYMILLNRADSLSAAINFLLGRSKANNNLCIGYKEEGTYTKALEKGLEAMRYSEKIGWQKGLAGNYSGIGSVYKAMHQNKKALEFYFKAYRLFEKLDLPVQVARNLGNIGTVYYADKDYTHALEFYNRSLTIHKKNKYKKGIFVMLGNIAVVYVNQGKYDTAYKYMLMTLDFSKEFNDRTNIAVSYQNIGDVLRKLNRLKESEHYTLMSLALADSLKYTELSSSNHENLSDLYEFQRDFKKSLFHYQKYIALRDSIFNEENTKKTIRLEMNYEFEKKEAAAKLEQEKKEAIANAESKKQKIIILAICGILILVFVFALFAYRSYLQKQKANNEISKQKETIEEKQKEIVDSIHYARRIQTALLPTEKYIERNLKTKKD